MKAIAAAICFPLLAVLPSVTAAKQVCATEPRGPCYEIRRYVKDSNCPSNKAVVIVEIPNCFTPLTHESSNFGEFSSSGESQSGQSAAKGGQGKKQNKEKKKKKANEEQQ
jgi:hypothetical protein